MKKALCIISIVAGVLLVLTGAMVALRYMGVIGGQEYSVGMAPVYAIFGIAFLALGIVKMPKREQ